jgi:hypothetical protein
VAAIGPTGQAKPHGVELSDGAGQTLGAPRARHDADPHLRLTELGALSGDDDVAAHRKLEPAAERVAVDRGDYGLGRARHRVPVALGAAAQHLHGARVDELAQIGTGGECLLIAGEHDRAHGRLLVERFEGRSERLSRRHIERIPGFRSIDADQGHAVVGPLDQHGLGSCCHRTSSGYTAHHHLLDRFPLRERPREKI